MIQEGTKIALRSNLLGLGQGLKNILCIFQLI